MADQANSMRVQMAQLDQTSIPLDKLPRFQAGRAPADSGLKPGDRYINADGTVLMIPYPPRPVIGMKRKTGVPAAYLKSAETIENAVAAAKAAGFDAIVWDIKDDALVKPASVGADLAKAVSLTRAAGLAADYVNTAIQDEKSAHAEDILAALKASGITQYRSDNYFRYDFANKNIYAQLDALKPRLAALAELNAKHGTRVLYHMSTDRNDIGCAIWDIWEPMKDLDPKLVGLDYDLASATLGNGPIGWLNAVIVVRPFIGAVTVRDFTYVKNGTPTVTNPPFKVQPMKIGEGFVDIPGMIEDLGRNRFNGPITLAVDAEAPTQEALAGELTSLRNVMSKTGFAV